VVDMGREVIPTARIAESNRMITISRQRIVLNRLAGSGAVFVDGIHALTRAFNDSSVTRKRCTT
jgi:hypothetical protein